MFQLPQFLPKALIVIQVCSLPLLASAQNDPLRVMFYNVENLYDTINDPTVDDEEFLPDSAKQWNTKKYIKKLNDLAKVVASAGPVHVLGLCEVENRKVVEDLVNVDALRDRGMKVVHKDSPDKRGVDVALAYDPKVFKLVSFKAINVPMPKGERPTRDILYTVLKTEKEQVHFFVNHWPSRAGGLGTDLKREVAARTLKHVTDSILEDNRLAKIVIMGDMNDTPSDVSVHNVLKAECDGVGLVNLMCPSAKIGRGTHAFKGEWQVLDQMIVSQGLLTVKGLKVEAKGATIIDFSWLLFTNKEGVSEPSRTYGGKDKYFGGYSDHLPITLDLTR